MTQNYGFSISCPCGNCVGDPPLLVIEDGNLAAWRAVLAKGSITPACPTCGCEHKLVDGTTQIDTVSVSKPSVASIGTATGPKAGGTTIAVVGHAFDIGTPVVRFEGVVGTNLAVADGEHLSVKTPAAPFIRVRVDWDTLVGGLGPGNVVTGSSSGKTGTIVGGTGSIVFLAGLTGVLTPGEWLEKDANNKVQVAASDIYAPCDVTVENGNGMRIAGGKLVEAFTYTP